MKIFYSDHYRIPQPENYFPTPKYHRLYQQLVEMNLDGARFVPSEPAAVDQIRLVHTSGYVRQIFQGNLSDQEMRRIGLPWSPELVERTRHVVGGTIGACRAALQDGLAANLAGGTHHAYPDHGEGFCIFNDIAIAIRLLQKEGLLCRSVILDCDAHQGNGTAAIFASDPSTFTFSIHCEKNYPIPKEQSDLDIGLPDSCNDDCYLTALKPGIESALNQAHADLAIYIGGADPFADDQLGRMKVSKAGLLERDRIVFNSCLRAGIPVVIVLGGGYAPQVEDTIDIHVQTIRLAVEISSNHHQPR